MPANTITDVDEFTDPVTSPGTAQKANQATFLAGLQAVSNRTRNHKNRLDENDTWRSNRMYSVLDYGAVGGGSNDDTTGIQAAINAAYQDSGPNNRGGIVWIPPVVGGYKVTSMITVHPYVTIKGAWGGFRRGTKVFDTDIFGSTISVTHTGIAFRMKTMSCIDGIEVWYPNQVTTGTPTLHEWTFEISNVPGCTLRNISAPNPYRLCFCDGDGALFEKIYAWPLETGFNLGRCAHVVHANTINFSPNAHPTVDASLVAWVLANGTAYKITGAEGFEFSQIHAFGYNRGMWLADAALVPSTGIVTGGGFDQCNEGFTITDKGTTNDGLRISNFVIVPKSAGVRILDTTQGGSADDKPRVMMSNVSIFNGGGYTRGVEIVSGSHGRLWWTNGECRDFTNEAIYLGSSNGVVRTFGLEVPSGTRVNNAGGGDSSETGTI